MATSQTLTRPPAVLPSYLRALWSTVSKRAGGGEAVPRSELVLTAVALGNARLARYQAVCGYGREVMDIQTFSVLNEAHINENVQRIRDKYVEKGYYLAQIEPVTHPEVEKGR